MALAMGSKRTSGRCAAGDVMPCRAGPCAGQNADPRAIGSEIGVRYVLRGQVQSSAERVRVNLTEDLTTWSPAVCGGVMDVFVERVGPDAPSTASGP